MLHEARRRLPAPLRPLHRETSASYLRRLCAANFLPPSSAAWFIRQVRAAKPGTTSQEATTHAAEWKGALGDGYFNRMTFGLPMHPDGTQCARCFTGLTGQHVCRLCAAGATAEQGPHLDGNVCLVHHLWIGPDTPPAQQYKVDADTVQGDIIWRKLCRQGWLDAHIYAELRSTFRRWASSVSTEPIPERAMFAPMMRMWQEVSTPSYQRKLLNPAQTFATAYEFLGHSVAGFLGEHESAVVVDGLWTMFRPAFLTTRERLGGDGQGTEQYEPHTLTPPVMSAQVQFPLEPFSRHLDQVRTCSADPWTDLNLRLAHRVHGPFARDALSVGMEIPTDYICQNGHRTRSHPSNMVKNSASGMRCAYCSNNKVLAGYNSLAETNPALALQWHPTKNGSLQPSGILAGSNSAKYWWQCTSGHEFEESPNNRSKGKGCPYCSRQRVIPGVTSLDITHRAVAAEWNRIRNGDLTPNMVLSGSNRVCWWSCPAGHDYKALISRRAAGGGCPVCSGYELRAGVNDLATMHPAIARTWHPTKNGSLSPADVLAGGRPTKRWWVCENGHAYDTPVAARISGTGCRYCANQVVLPGFNSLADTDMNLAQQWHPTKNLPLRPTDVVVGSAKRIWWLCARGHDFVQPVVQRRAGGGCPYCRSKAVWPGFNDAATQYPFLFQDWHPTRNNGVEPSQILPGLQRRWWLCSSGHEQERRIKHRADSGGCSECPKEKRVGWIEGPTAPRLS